MRRKNFLFWSGMLLLVVAGIAAVLFFLVSHEPAFYRRAAVPQGQERKVQSMLFQTALIPLVECFSEKHYPSKKEKENGWNFSYSEEQINSYFQEGTWGEIDTLKRHGIWEPRLVIEADRIRLAFRYGTKPWSTIMSLDLRVWLVPKEVNVVALEILARRAGALPISAQFFLDQVSDMAQKSNIDVTWYRNNGNPVALFRFQSDRVHPTAQLRRLELRPGKITIGGSPVEPAISLLPAPRPTFHQLRASPRLADYALAANPLSPPWQGGEKIVRTSIYPPPVAPEELEP